MAETQLDNAGGLHLDGVAESLEFLAGLDEGSAVERHFDEHDLTLMIGTSDNTTNLKYMTSKGML